MIKKYILMLVMIGGMLTLIGCTTIRNFTRVAIAELDARDAEWRSKYFEQAVSNFLAKVESGEITTKPNKDSGKPDSLDQLDFNLFNFTYGGFKANNAVMTDVSPRISNLRFDKRSLYFTYDRGLDGWGFSHSDPGAICAVFFKNTEGRWVGGKFDWISTSRTSRELKHCTTEPTYSNWTMAGIPNPCEAAFVIFDRVGRQRSNVLKATWSR